jgi:2-hydroxy-6-oxonona-2,4-dienedioate hydrolase
MDRRQFLKATVNCSVVVGLNGAAQRATAQAGPIIPVVPSPEIDAFRMAQQQLLKKYGVSAKSRFIKLRQPALTAHLLEAGRGEAVLMLHGGGNFSCQFTPLIAALQQDVQLFALDRPGCGLTDKVDYRDVVLRQHAIDVVTSVLDELGLPRAHIVGHSMGGWWALVFALAKPERVNKLVFLGEPAWSGPVAHAPPPAAKNPTLEGVRAAYSARLVTDIRRVPEEMFEASLAANRLPGAALSWDTLITKFLNDRVGTYHLRPELKNLKPETLFIWGNEDKFGPPALGKEMAAMTSRARCEVLSDAGHLIWVDQLERCAQLTRDFFSVGA